MQMENKTRKNKYPAIFNAQNKSKIIKTPVNIFKQYNNIG